MAQRAFKSPLDQANSLIPKETTRSKWNRYFKHIGDGNPRTVDKYNRLIEEIESELPFENEDEHKKWLDLGSTWTGGSEWPQLTESLLGRIKSGPFDFDSKSDDELLDAFIKSSGWGFDGSHKDGKFRFSGPDWDSAYNPMSRAAVIRELKERKRIDDEEDGDWFSYLNEEDN